ncbi:MAG: HDOD domain-containing protein [Pseudomonadota bacterium]|jgi:EAL and modified HD-GYP domain-containing signal transduction protein
MSVPVPETAPGLLLPQLLAQADGRPAAVHWHCSAPLGPAEQALLLEWAARLPCVLSQSEGLCAAPEALQGTAVQLATPQALFWCAEPVWPIRLPPAARWLAGDWYLKLSPRGTAAQTASRQRAMALLKLLTQDADTHELEAVFRQDPTLSYQLLRLVNSAAVGARREITSFGQAILLLGRQALKRWVNLLLFAARDDDPRSAMLLAHVCLRARGLELLAQAAGQDRLAQDEAFMAGVLSMLDVLLGQPLPDILQPLRLSDPLRLGLLEGQSPIGALLRLWQAIEQRQPAAAVQQLAALGVTIAQANALLAQACQWTFELKGAASGHGSRT